MIDQGSNHVVVKCLQVSIDPYQLNRMKRCSSSQSSVSKLVPGKPIDAHGVGRVLASENPEFKKGDLVVGRLKWADYVLLEHSKSLRKLDTMGFPLSYHLGILGISGLTAYVGLFKICKPEKGDRILVSSASGSVGNLVGQYAKLLGCYVVGCGGTKEKVALLKEKLRFDDAFNYKEESDIKLALRRYFPDGIDIYFDNVGGKLLEAAVPNMNPYGRIAACGAISQYTDSANRSAAAIDMIDIIYKQIVIQGFLTHEFADECYEDFMSMTSTHLHAGEIQVLEDISYGLESIPSAFEHLFQGHNLGKTIVQIAND